MRDAFGKLPCLKKKTCKIRLNGPCMNTDIDLSITIQRTDSASTDFDVVKLSMFYFTRRDLLDIPYDEIVRLSNNEFIAR